MRISTSTFRTNGAGEVGPVKLRASLAVGLVLLLLASSVMAWPVVRPNDGPVVDVSVGPVRFLGKPLGVDASFRSARLGLGYYFKDRWTVSWESSWFLTDDPCYLTQKWYGGTVESSDFFLDMIAIDFVLKYLVNEPENLFRFYAGGGYAILYVKADFDIVPPHDDEGFASGLRGLVGADFCVGRFLPEGFNPYVRLFVEVSPRFYYSIPEFENYALVNASRYDSVAFLIGVRGFTF